MWHHPLISAYSGMRSQREFKPPQRVPLRENVLITVHEATTPLQWNGHMQTLKEVGVETPWKFLCEDGDGSRLGGAAHPCKYVVMDECSRLGPLWRKEGEKTSS